MIGQKRIIDKINRWKEVPRFLIFNGYKYCGKKELAKYIASKFNLQLILIGNKIDEIRNMIKLANEYDTHIIFLIDDGNKMSLGAENTLLKITEEAPNNTHIILTVENKDLLLPTIISRGEVITFQDYLVEDFNEYLHSKNLIDSNVNINEEIKMVYPNLGYVDLLPINKVKELGEFCYKISNYIREANGASAFKIQEKIKLKEEQEGYDLFQFIYCLKDVCYNNLLESVKTNNELEYKYQLAYVQILTTLERMMTNPLFNKSYILDKLIIDFKAVYFE